MDKIKIWVIFGIFLLIIWFSLLAFLWMKADEITKHPCQVCAKVSGEQVTCILKNSITPISKTYYPDGKSEEEEWGRKT